MVSSINDLAHSQQPFILKTDEKSAKMKRKIDVISKFIDDNKLILITLSGVVFGVFLGIIPKTNTKLKLNY